MSLQATTTVEVSVDVSVRVPRGGSGDLSSGVAAVLGGVEAVESVTVDRVTSVRPTYTDINVDADATVHVAVPSEADPATAAQRRLVDGFGVTGVDELRVES